MARETSEDAVTWNVFRHLETSGLLGPWLASLTGSSVGKSSLIYWSYCDEPSVRGVWPTLAKARDAFSERKDHPSEPDLIADTEAGLFWIEAKLTASNKTKPSADAKPEAYKAGGDRWYSKVIATSFERLAIAEQRYEMLRYWLLGTWAAAHLNKPFYLVSLVRRQSKENMAGALADHFRKTPERQILSTTWEDIYGFLDAIPHRAEHTDPLLAYMKNKTAGYNSRGVLRGAFAL